MKHTHRWARAWTSGKAVGFKCRCDARKERPATAAERQEWRDTWKAHKKESRHMHRLFHDFMRRFSDSKTDRWKFKGYDFMQRAERWAKRNPEVIIAGCDDSYHSSSNIVLIPHRCLSGAVWGTSCVVIPQHGGDPCEFFLYPGHAAGLVKAIHSAFKRQP